mmetsp:Transcript_17649/g.54747  ORF Transcript_17649/g.54747 Transcript_17649/m.54747 type:complete len:278 (+) Transcript_17649:85-918(+)
MPEHRAAVRESRNSDVVYLTARGIHRRRVRIEDGNPGSDIGCRHRTGNLTCLRRHFASRRRRGGSGRCRGEEGRSWGIDGNRGYADVRSRGGEHRNCRWLLVKGDEGYARRQSAARERRDGSCLGRRQCYFHFKHRVRRQQQLRLVREHRVLRDRPRLRRFDPHQHAASVPREILHHARIRRHRCECEKAHRLALAVPRPELLQRHARHPAPHRRLRVRDLPQRRPQVPVEVLERLEALNVAVAQQRVQSEVHTVTLREPRLPSAVCACRLERSASH